MTLAFFRVGEGTRPLLLLHGFLGAGRNLTTLAKKLVEQDASLAIIVPDLTGHGASPPFAAHDDLHTMARDLLELARSLDLGDDAPFAIMGHSLGGRVGLAAALAAPRAIRRITLLDITPAPIAVTDSDSVRIVQLIASGPQTAAAREPFREHLRAGGVPQSLVEWQMLNLVQEGGVYRWRIDAARLAELHPRISATDLWAAVERPGRGYSLHEVRGERSPYVSDADAARLAAAGCAVDTLAGVGHFVHVEGLPELLQKVQPWGPA
jgi:pimeloyl-ACP methyl ester carboxylesterase